MANKNDLFYSDPLTLSDLLSGIHSGEIQIPDFQRPWVWPTKLICSLISSVSLGYPVGTLLLLKTKRGRSDFGFTQVCGAPNVKARKPSRLVLDGQQRLTALYLALRADHTEEAIKESGARARKIFYFDLQSAVGEVPDRENAVIFKKLNYDNSDFHRAFDIRNTVCNQEFKDIKFPLHMAFSKNLVKWEEGFFEYHKGNRLAQSLYQKFTDRVLANIQGCKIPTVVISDDADRATVCHMFETINSKAKNLTVFDLLTARFSAVKFNLPEDMKTKLSSMKKHRVLNGVGPIEFVQALALLTRYENRSKGGVSCARESILRLTVDDYKKSAIRIERGFCKAAKFLEKEGIVSQSDIPYESQLVPLAAILAHLGARKASSRRGLVAQWFWCGVFGERYSRSTDSHSAIDMREVCEWVTKQTNEPAFFKDVEVSFRPLLAKAIRRSALFKGVMALIRGAGCVDLVSGNLVSHEASQGKAMNYHHIFPKAYCKGVKPIGELRDSIINLTPILASTNKWIGDKAPSTLINKIVQEKEAKNSNTVKRRVLTHFIDTQCLEKDDFREFLRLRTKDVGELIAKAIGQKYVEWEYLDEALSGGS